jgi:hypothetical protein
LGNLQPESVSSSSLRDAIARPKTVNTYICRVLKFVVYIIQDAPLDTHKEIMRIPEITHIEVKSIKIIPTKKNATDSFVGAGSPRPWR